MRRLSLLLIAVAVLSACGSSSPKASPTTGTTNVQELSSPLWDKAGPTPSKSAKMVCEPEARDDIAASLGVKATRVTTPVWVKAQHLYSCTYVYPHGRITLHVKELVDERTTTAYYNGVRKKYGTTQPIIGLGQGAWILENNDLVVRKDYKVLLVDVTGIPVTFVPAMTRSDVALNIAETIMGCWTGQ